MILGIGSSCDETAVAVLDSDGVVLSNVIASQSVHELYNGVVPEIASREHVRHLLPVLDRALEEALREPRSIGEAVGLGPA